jgi:multidrug transporter EmrE-like cation transporter
MNLEGILLTTCCAIFTASGNLLMRSGISSAGEYSLAPGEILNSIFGLAFQPKFLFGFLLYGLAAIIWFRVLASQQISLAYPSFVGLTFILLTGAAAFLLKERLAVSKLIGVALIFAGIVIIGRS